MLLQTSIEHVASDTVVITLQGSLTLGTSLKTADMQIQQTIASGACWLVLEMSGVPYMDSAGLGALVHTAGVVRERGGALRLAGVTERVRSLLAMTRTDALLPADADQATALAKLKE